MRYHKEVQVRKAIVREANLHGNNTSLAHCMRVHVSELSRALNGGHVAGKISAWVGYRKVRVKLYERISGCCFWTESAPMRAAEAALAKHAAQKGDR